MARRSVCVSACRDAADTVEEEENVATKAIVGEKVGMTQVWDDQNRAVPVTVVRVGPAPRRPGEDARAEGYAAVQVTWGTRRTSTLDQARAGPLRQGRRGAGQAARRAAPRRRERVTPSARRSCVDVFDKGEMVDATAVSKGKGFAGGMKRHNFSGQGGAHGNHKHHRAPGSIGACATPGRVFKGTRMAGRMGGTQVTTTNLEVDQRRRGAPAGARQGRRAGAARRRGLASHVGQEPDEGRRSR